MADVVNKVYFIFLAATASITGSTGWLTLILPDLIGLVNSLDNQEFCIKDIHYNDGTYSNLGGQLGTPAHRSNTV